MRLGSIEGQDNFGGEVVFWVSLLELPQKIQDEAKLIDGENYNPDCFGICVHYDVDADEFSLSPDEAGTNIYYVDNDGNKKWLFTDMDEVFSHELFTMCEYEYTKNNTVSVENGSVADYKCDELDEEQGEEI